MTDKTSYIIAARRTALGRPGGLHRSRRLTDLAAPVVGAVITDAQLTSQDVGAIFVGNATEGGNPARVISLGAGLPDSCAALSLDRQCASGLDAIVAGLRAIEAGDADVIVAGGAESLSTAPWRIAKPRSIYQLPRFMRIEPGDEGNLESSSLHEPGERLAASDGISRKEQDDFAWSSYTKATAAREANRFVGEIVPLRGNAEEMRDQSAIDTSLEDIADVTPFLPPDGTLTPGNTSAMHDGAAFVAGVSGTTWEAMGSPPAVRLISSVAIGVTGGAEAQAPIAAVKRLLGRPGCPSIGDIGAVEISESSAAQAIAFSRALSLADGQLNADGGAVARGHPFGAAGAVLVVRLFSRLLRNANGIGPRYGLAALGTLGGLGCAALFEAVRMRAD